MNLFLNDFSDNEAFGFSKATNEHIIQPDLAIQTLETPAESTSSSPANAAGPALPSAKIVLDFSEDFSELSNEGILDAYIYAKNCAPDDAYANGNVVWPTPLGSTGIQLVDSFPVQESPLLHDRQDNKGHLDGLNEVLRHLLREDEQQHRHRGGDWITAMANIQQPVTNTPSTSSTCSWSSQPQSRRKRELFMEYKSSIRDSVATMIMEEEFDRLSQPKRQRFTAANINDTHGDDGPSPTGSVASSSTTAGGRSSKTTNHASLWRENYFELCKFQEKHGHCIVPPKENYTLWRWVKRQRYLYKQMHEGRQAYAISNERIGLLEGIGFVWDSQGTVWMDRLNELAQYRSIHGHCNVPSKYLLNPQLSTWVKCQRRQYKLYCEEQSGRAEGAKHKSNMTAKRIEALRQLDFVFDPRSEKKSISTRKP